MQRLAKVLLCLLFSLSVKAQNDFPISVLSTPSVMINPAMGLFDGSLRLQAFYKGQFEKNMHGGIKSTGFSADYFLENQRMGLGLAVFSNSVDVSALRDFNALATYNYHLDIGEWHIISFGLQAGYKQIGFSVEDLKFGSQYDPTYQGGYNPNKQPSYITEANRNMLDVSVGVAWDGFIGSDLIANVGLSAFHLLPVKTEFLSENQKLMPKYVGLLKLTYESLRMHWHPSFIYVYQNEQSYFETGLMTSILQLDQSVNIGLFYRSGNAIIPAVGLSLRNFSLNLSLEYYFQNKFPNIFNITFFYYPQFNQSSRHYEEDFNNF